MKQEIKLGRTDYTVLVFVPDPASTDGSGKTGLAHTDMTVSYTRLETDNDVVITDATSSLNALTNLTDAHNDWGWKEVSSALAPGLYRLDLADAVLATGIWSAVVYVMITSSAAAASPMEFIAVAYDPLDTVRLGLTALPNAAAEAAGGLYTRGTGAGQINQAANGMIDVDAIRISGSTTAADNAEIVYSTDFAANYDTTNDVWKVAVTHWIATAVATPTVNGVPEVDVTHAAGTAVQAASGRFQVDLELWLGSAPNALISGRVDSDVGAMQANTITASATAADSIDSSALSTTAVDEIAAAVWAAAARTLTALDEDNTTLDLDATIRAAVGLSAANLDTQIGDLPTNAELATSQAAADDATLAAIAALNNLSAAQVNAEVVDALNVDTYAEPGQATPGATATLTSKIGYLYKAWRNKSTQTASAYNLYNDDAATVDQKATTSDDAVTFTRGEVASGP